MANQNQHSNSPIIKILGALIAAVIVAIPSAYHFLDGNKKTTDNEPTTKIIIRTDSNNKPKSPKQPKNKDKIIDKDKADKILKEAAEKDEVQHTIESLNSIYTEAKDNNLFGLFD